MLAAAWSGIRAWQDVSEEWPFRPSDPAWAVEGCMESRSNGVVAPHGSVQLRQFLGQVALC